MAEPAATPEPFFDAEQPGEAAVATPQPAPAKPAHNSRSLRLADEFGFAKADVDGMSPAELDAAVYQTQLAVNRIQRDNLDRMTRMQAAEPRPAPPAPPPPPPPEDDLGFDETEIHPGIAQALKKTLKNNADLRKELDVTRQQAQVRETMTRAEVLDDAFDALGESFAAIVGTGGGSEISKEEMQRRVAIINASGAGNSDTSRALRSKIKAAAQSLYGPLLKAAAPAAPAAAPDPYAAAAAAPAAPAQPRGADGRFTREEWERASLARPTQRNGSKEPSGVSKAVNSVGQLLRERGLLGDDGGSGDAQPGDFLGNQ